MKLTDSQFDGYGNWYIEIPDESEDELSATNERLASLKTVSSCLKDLI